MQSGLLDAESTEDDGVAAAVAEEKVEKEDYDGEETLASAYVLRVQHVFSQERIVQGCENTRR